VVDVGCGRGHDAVWLARQGVPTVGLDFAPAGFAALEALAAREPGLPLRVGRMNLLETRHVLGWGARLSRAPGPRVLLARHVADAVTAAGRENLWRLARMVARPGGRLYLEFLVEARSGDRWVRQQRLAPLRPEEVVRGLRAHGGSIVSREVVTGTVGGAGAADAGRRQVCRMVVEWTD
jgi:hypothetical protein